MTPLLNFFRWVFESYIGQRVLIVLAPFFLSPYEYEQQASTSLFRKLHIPHLAPSIGGVFLLGGVLMLVRLLQDYHLGWVLWPLQLETWRGVVRLGLWLCLVFHSLALAKYFGQSLSKKETGKQPYTLAFWNSYFGGIAMVLGLFAWLFVGLVHWHLSWKGFLVAGVFLAGLGVLIRLELGRRYQRLLLQHTPRPPTHGAVWEGSAFVLLVGVGGVLIEISLSQFR